MLHDILVTVGVYALSGREVTVSTVAAVLTVLGYSIYDTIIVFDRVRENIPLMPQSTFARSRTSRSPRRCAARWRRRSSRCCRSSPLRLGGQTLKDFAFALHHRHRSRRRLDDLRRDAVPDRADGARAGVPAPRRQRGRSTRASCPRRCAAAGAERPARARWRAQPVDEPDRVDGRPEPEFVDVAPRAPSDANAQARRDKRRQRRRTRPHGRAR